MDLQLKYKAQYRYLISAGVILESMLKASMHRSHCCSRGRQWHNSQLTSMRGGADPEWNKGMEETTLYGNGKRSKTSSYQQKIHVAWQKYTKGQRNNLCPGESKIARWRRTCGLGTGQGPRPPNAGHGVSVCWGPGLTQAPG